MIFTFKMQSEKKEEALTGGWRLADDMNGNNNNKKEGRYILQFVDM